MSRTRLKGVGLVNQEASQVFYTADIARKFNASSHVQAGKTPHACLSDCWSIYCITAPAQMLGNIIYHYHCQPTYDLGSPVSALV